MRLTPTVAIAIIAGLGCSEENSLEPTAEARLAAAPPAPAPPAECPAGKFTLLFIITSKNGAKGSIATAVQNVTPARTLTVEKIDEGDGFVTYRSCIDPDANQEIHGSVTAQADEGVNAYMNWSKRLIDRASLRVTCNQNRRCTRGFDFKTQGQQLPLAMAGIEFEVTQPANCADNAGGEGGAGGTCGTGGAGGEGGEGGAGGSGGSGGYGGATSSTASGTGGYGGYGSTTGAGASTSVSGSGGSGVTSSTASGTGGYGGYGSTTGAGASTSVSGAGGYYYP
jgi:hypothetical protein